MDRIATIETEAGGLNRNSGEVVTLGSEPSYAEAYRRLAGGAAGVAGVLVQDIATARLLAADSPWASTPALVFGDVGHPRVARYATLARRVEHLLPASRTAVQALPLVAPDTATASALWLGGFSQSIRVHRAPLASAKPPGPRTHGLNLAVLGATTSWRARLAGQALAAALLTRPADCVVRVHLDASMGDCAPRDWDCLQPLDVGEPVHLALFIDGGCFGDLVQRLHRLRAGGARIFTSGAGAYTHAPQCGPLDARPDTIFDSLRTIVAAALEEAR